MITNNIEVSHWGTPNPDGFHNWLTHLAILREIQSDGHLSPAYIKQTLRVRLEFPTSDRSAAEKLGIDTKWVKKYLGKVRKLRLNWPLIEGIEPTVLKNVLYPTKKAGPHTKPDFPTIHQKIQEDKSTRHQEWLQYACIHHQHKTYGMSHFYALYDKWLEAEKETRKWIPTPDETHHSLTDAAPRGGPIQA
ncbi:hypothetical protein [Variovorax paradoxus]|uniref:hypothetical protein n=1 Tax=Variovorax paradoxus TaxID=34073 RepID=UPI003ECCFE8A